MPDRSPLDALPASARAVVRKATSRDWFTPMLATLTEEPFSRAGWIFEPKFDGERALAFREHEEVRLVSRNQKLLNEKYPELVTAFESQELDWFVADGEIVTFAGEVSSFTRLQQRMQVQHPSAELRRKIPVWFCAFDVLLLDGYDVRQLPLRWRKELLGRAIRFRDPLRPAEFRETSGEAFYREACKRHWEGIIAKNGDSPYVSGRSAEWLKFKCINEQEFVIAGYTDPKGHRVGFGAVLVGYYNHGKFRYAGKVGTGFDTRMLNKMTKQLTDSETKINPFSSDDLDFRGVHWVKPQLVAVVRFTEWTRDGKLRHPRFLGLRDDKSAEEVVRERNG